MAPAGKRITSGDPAGATILLTGVTCRSGLAIGQALARGGHRVVGVDTRRFPLRLRSRFLQQHHVLRADTEEGTVEQLLDLGDQVGADLLLPVETKMVRLVARHRARFDARMVVNVPRTEVVEEAFDHRRTIEVCHRLGLPAPQPLTLEEAMDRVQRGIPMVERATIVVKPRYDVGGGTGVRYVEDIDALMAGAAACSAEYGEPTIQEYVPGPASSMRTAFLLFDPTAHLVASFTMRTLRQQPASGGITAIGISTDEQTLVELVRPLFEHWRWTGPAAVVFKVDRRDGGARVIKVSPRLTGDIGFPVACGLNLPDLLVRTALGKTPPVSRDAYRIGLTWINRTALVANVVDACRRRPGFRPLRDAARVVLRPRARFGGMLTDPAGHLGKLAMGLMDRVRRSPAPSDRPAPPAALPPACIASSDG